MNPLFRIATLLVLLPSCTSPPAPEGRGTPTEVVRRYVRIEPGTFLMGSPETEPGRFKDERLHEVRITRPFLLQATEVTREQWRDVMNSEPSWSRHPGCGDACPVDSVSWFDVVVYANALSIREDFPSCYALDGCDGDPGGGCPWFQTDCNGDHRCRGVRFEGLDCLGYRLPTEAEWEYAARAGTTTAFSTGPGIRGDQAAFITDKELRVSPVGSFPPNPWGLYDLHGNVYEFVWDWYSPFPGRAPVTDPQGPNSGNVRVVRGGSAGFSSEHLRSAHRSAMIPWERSNQDGFRLARTLPSDPPPTVSSCGPRWAHR